MTNKYPYCEQFGFDQEAIDMRLLMMDMGASELELSEQFLDRIMHPMQQQIVDDFYVGLLKKPEFMHILNTDGVDVADLKKTQTHYLSTLGKNFNTADYFDSRLKIGWVHFQVGVPLSLYQSAYRILQQIFIRAICRVITDENERLTFINST